MPELDRILDQGYTLPIGGLFIGIGKGYAFTS
jgi:hypothetical protein